MEGTFNCPECGSENPSYAVYCSSCSYMIKRPDAVAEDIPEKEGVGQYLSFGNVLLALAAVGAIATSFLAFLVFAAGAVMLTPKVTNKVMSEAGMGKPGCTIRGVLGVGFFAIAAVFMGNAGSNNSPQVQRQATISETHQTTPPANKITVIFDGPKLLNKPRSDVDAVLGNPIDIQDVKDNQTGDIFYRQVTYHKDGIEYQVNFNEMGVFDTHINRIGDGSGKPKPLTNIANFKKLPLLAGYPEQAPDSQTEMGIGWENIGNAGSLRFMVVDGKPTDMMIDAKEILVDIKKVVGKNPAQLQAMFGKPIKTEQTNPRSTNCPCRADTFKIKDFHKLNDLKIDVVYINGVADWVTIDYSEMTKSFSETGNKMLDLLKLSHQEPVYDTDSINEYHDIDGLKVVQFHEYDGDTSYVYVKAKTP